MEDILSLSLIHHTVGLPQSALIVSQHTVDIIDAMGDEEMQESVNLLSATTKTLTSNKQHSSTLKHCIIFHMQTTLPIIFPAPTHCYAFLDHRKRRSSSHPVLHLFHQAGWHIHDLSSMSVKERRSTYCRVHIRTGLPGTCMFRGTGQEIHLVRPRQRTGSCCYIWNTESVC